MSSSIKQNLAADQILRINNFDLVGLVQSFDWTPNMGNDPDYELGNHAKVGDNYEGDVTASVTLKSNGGLPGVLARLIENRSGSDAFLGYQYNSGGANGKNGYTFTQDDFAKTRADLVLHERPDGVSFTRSTWLPRMQLASIAGTVNANGAATETLNFSGSDDVGFPKPWHDIVSVPCTVTDASHITCVDTTIASSSYTLLYVMVNENRFRNSTSGDATTFTLGTAGALTMSTTAGFVIPADADCHACVCKTTGSATFPSLTTAQRGTTATSVRGNKIDIFIAPANAAAPTQAEKWLCAQSLSWNVSTNLSNLDQIAYTDRNSSTYTRVVNFPLAISVSTNVYETDWVEWQKMLTGTFDGTTLYQNTYEFAPQSIKTNFAIVLDYYTKAGSKLMRLTFGDMSPSGRGKQVGVGGRSEIQWGFSGTLLTVQGFNA